MKSYNGLFEQMLDIEEVKSSIDEAAAYKKDRKVVRSVLVRKDEKAEELIQKILEGTWNPPHHEKHRLREGSHKKEREIIKPRWDDEQIVHHMIVRQLRPIIEPRLYRYAYGSLPGRGTHGAVRAMKNWRDKYGKRRFYVFEGDIRKFYDNIDTEILKKKLRIRIRDKRFLALLDKVIDTAAPGLPKGFYTSPWLANFYLEAFDNFVVQELKPDHYIRYMDNLFILHSNKKELHKMVDQLMDYLCKELKLWLNSNWQVYRFESYDRKSGKMTGRAINALGFVIHRDRVTIRKSVLERVRRKANKMYKKKKLTKHDCMSMVSRMSYFRYANAYQYYKKYIKPKVSIGYCKRRISELSRRENRNDRIYYCSRWKG